MPLTLFYFPYLFHLSTLWFHLSGRNKCDRFQETDRLLTVESCLESYEPALSQLVTDMNHSTRERLCLSYQICTRTGRTQFWNYHKSCVPPFITSLEAIINRVPLFFNSWGFLTVAKQTILYTLRHHGLPRYIQWYIYPRYIIWHIKIKKLFSQPKSTKMSSGYKKSRLQWFKVDLKLVVESSCHNVICHFQKFEEFQTIQWSYNLKTMSIFQDYYHPEYKTNRFWFLNRLQLVDVLKNRLTNIKYSFLWPKWNSDLTRKPICKEAKKGDCAVEALINVD